LYVRATSFSSKDQVLLVNDRSFSIIGGMVERQAGGGERRAEHRETVRSRILDGARSAFLSGGYRGTNVPAIAAAAGVSVGLIYRYFPNKEALFIELCLASSEPTYRALAEDLRAIPDPVHRLVAAFDAYLDAYEGPTGALLVMALSSASGEPRVRAALETRSRELVGFSKGFIEDAKARGEVPETLDSDSIALAVATLLDGTIVAMVGQGEGLDRSALRDAIVALVASAAGVSTEGPQVE
jgi:AcrR family transcriptional regulator